MADIFDILISVLCPTSDSVSYCRSFIDASHHQTLAPLGPLFYFLLFPAVFIILFIYWLSGRVISEHKGLRVLVGISAFIFIIISGWYPAALWISEIWYIATIILLGLWVFFERLWKGSEKGGTTGLPWSGRRQPGLLSRLSEKTVKKYLEKPIERKFRLRDDEKSIYDDILHKFRKAGNDFSALNQNERRVIEIALAAEGGVTSEEQDRMRGLLKKAKEED